MRRAVRASIALLPLAMLAACGRPATPRQATDPADDVAIFAALLAEACAHPFWDKGQSIVLDVPASTAGEDASSWKWQPPAEYVDGWQGRPSTTTRWPKLSPFAAQRVVEKASVDTLLEQDHKIPPSYEKFYAAFPDARETVQVSLPAYSADGQTAAVFEVFDHEGLSKAADVVEFHRSGSGWQQVRVHNVWVRSF